MSTLSRTPRRERDGGFSLLEVVLTVALLGMATLSTMLMLVPIARGAVLRREVQTANSTAEQILEKIHATPFNQIQTIYPQGYTKSLTGLKNGSVSISYADPAADPLLVQVDLTWDGKDGGTMTRSFHTARTE